MAFFGRVVATENSARNRHPLNCWPASLPTPRIRTILRSSGVIPCRSFIRTRNRKYWRAFFWLSPIIYMQTCLATFVFCPIRHSWLNLKQKHWMLADTLLAHGNPPCDLSPSTGPAAWVAINSLLQEAMASGSAPVSGIRTMDRTPASGTLKSVALPALCPPQPKEKTVKPWGSGRSRGDEKILNFKI